MRGALCRVRLATNVAGIIPARAGSTRIRCRQPSPLRDHPRSCGEHMLSILRWTSSRGSSPLVRGALNHLPGSLNLLGIIPARAGSTAIGTLTGPTTADHPRSCGEHSPHLRKRGRGLGSSPLVRGALADAEVLSAIQGIIPARAGSTGWCLPRELSRRDHPRSCGEHPQN